MPRGGGRSSGGGGRCYVDNASNRSLGRVGMPVGSMVVSSGGSSSGYSGGSSGRTYVDNASNRSLGRVGMPIGSMVVSSGGSSSGYSSGSSGRTYVDNASNRSLGRVGMPVGSMVVSSGRSSSGNSGGSSGKTYVDNASNRRLGRVGMPVGSMVVSNGRSTSAYSGESRKTYVDNDLNRSLGRVGMPLGTMPVSGGDSAGGSSSSPKTYVDNAQNRKLGRVGMEHGTMVLSKSLSSSERPKSSPGHRYYVDNGMNQSLGRVGLPYGAELLSEVKRYKDNPMNRRLGRVGKPLGTAIHSASGDKYRTYVDNPENRRLGRVGYPVGSLPHSRSSAPRRTYCDNTLNRSLNRVGKELGSMPISRVSKQTEAIQRTFQHLLFNPDEEAEWMGRQDCPEEMEEEATDAALNMLNRLQIEREWQREHQTTKLPTTKASLLEKYKGPSIDLSDLHLQAAIGQGGFGVVHYATLNETVVAVKKLRITRVSQRRLKEFIEEVTILSKLSHPYIVKFIGACTQTPNLCIVMEYMKTSLYEALHIRSSDIKELEEADRLAMINQTLSGLEYLHSKDVAHCDIKSQNILLDHDGEKFLVAKLSDFGLSMMKNETESLTSSKHDAVRNVGTPRYSAPEVLRGELLNRDQMKMSDMYSYALVVFEIVYEEEPFRNMSANQLKKQIGEKGAIPDIPDDIKVNLDLLGQLLACWDRDALQRPTSTDFLFVTEQLRRVYDKYA